MAYDQYSSRSRSGSYRNEDNRYGQQGRRSERGYGSQPYESQYNRPQRGRSGYADDHDDHAYRGGSHGSQRNYGYGNTYEDDRPNQSFRREFSSNDRGYAPHSAGRDEDEGYYGGASRGSRRSSRDYDDDALTEYPSRGMRPGRGWADDTAEYSDVARQNRDY
jgi:hypothetical protein